MPQLSRLNLLASKFETLHLESTLFRTNHTLIYANRRKTVSHWPVKMGQTMAGFAGKKAIVMLKSSMTSVNRRVMITKRSLTLFMVK
jgi:hypothetical protein